MRRDTATSSTEVVPLPSLKDIMTKKMLIDATHAEETRVVVVDGNKVDEFDFESLNKRQLAGNIYLAKVTRVEPSLQAAFVEYGGNRHGFLAFSEIHPDYYQIPKADREALLAEEAAIAREAEEEAASPRGRSRGRRRSSRASAEGAASAADAVAISETTEDVSGESPEIDRDAPPPSAASGEVDIRVVEEPSEDGDADAPEPPTDAALHEAGDNSDEDDDAVVDPDGEYEDVGGANDAADERPVRKPRPRRYKIQEVIKVRQILLVQVVKEERGNKGAALTTYLSLAGRYCVLMPNTARGGGISRKITNVADRKKLKEISNSITVPEGAGLIIRTAGSNRTKTEIKRDYEYLLRQWEQIRDLTLKSIAPCLIYEEGSLIKRVIRDLYSRDIDEILIDGERGYREAKDYMKMLMPSHAKNVKHYADPLPLFSRFQVESYLSAMFNPVVQLKSGGYIVIDVTEALVAIDVNSGRATRESSIEETALKTNMEAAEEAARQMRLRDLAGLIVIDFIDMDERRNNASVEKKLKDKLKTDRARIQVGRISGFGLLEMSRQRLRPGMIEATTKACPHCHGTGRVRSDDSIALALLREIEEEGVRQRSKEILVVAPVEIANYMLNQKREHIAMIESRFGLSVRVEADGKLISPDYRIERFKTASRLVPPAAAIDSAIRSYTDSEPDDEVEAETEVEVDDEADAGGTGSGTSAEAAGESADGSGGRKRRRRRRRGGKGGSNGNGEAASEAPADTAEATEDTDVETVALQADADGQADTAERPRSRRRSRRRKPSENDTAETVAETDPQTDSVARSPAPAGGLDDPIDLGDDTPADIVDVPETGVTRRPASRPRVRKAAAAVLGKPDAVVPGPLATEDAAPEPAATPEADSTPAPEPEAEEVAQAAEPELEDALVAEATVEPQPEKSAEPKRRGWWSRAISGS